MEASYRGEASVTWSLLITPFSNSRVSCFEPCSSAMKGVLFVNIKCARNHMPRFQLARCFLNFFSLLDLLGS